MKEYEIDLLITKEGIEKLFKKHNDNFEKVIKELNELMKKNSFDADYVQELLEEHFNINLRVCSNCGKLMYRGTVFFGGEDYACSDECRREFANDDKFKRLCVENEDTYETDWEELDDKGKILNGYRSKSIRRNDFFDKWLNKYVCKKQLCLESYFKVNLDSRIHLIEFRSLIEYLKDIEDTKIKQKIRMDVNRIDL